MTAMQQHAPCNSDNLQASCYIQTCNSYQF